MVKTPQTLIFKNENQSIKLYLESVLINDIKINRVVEKLTLHRSPLYKNDRLKRFINLPLWNFSTSNIFKFI
ncbi:hypothetical protein A6J42_20890 [Leptospira interrogans serovar Copenhageni]|nr:hypothetical protein A6J42_20890 [Leptospira interrogans serovar Copenhageni]KAA1267987.1 hypothetical protein C5473_08185 [Leptospira interrogans serovar Weerasinghe]KAA1291378.1 hypothetical protein C4X99_14300 [Leptospira interrogans serovar Geyaweera]